MTQIQKSLVSAVLFVLAALGAVALATWEKRSRVEESERQEKDKKAFEFKAEDVTAVTITHEGKTVVAAKDGSTWKIEEPIKTLGDDATFASVVTAVVNLSFLHRLKPGELQPKDVSLDSPATQVRLTLSGGKTAEVWLGVVSSFDDAQQYVRAGEKAAEAPLVIVSKYALSAFQKGLFDLREKRLVTDTTADVDALSVTVATPSTNAVSFTAVRLGEKGKHSWEDGWRLSAPLDTLGDKDELSRLAGNLTGLRAVAFLDDGMKNPKAVGLDKPSVTVTLTTPAGPRELEFAWVKNGSANKYYARRKDQPAVAEVGENVYTGLIKDLWALRDKRLADLDKDAVRTIHATWEGGGVVTLARSASDAGPAETWSVVEPQPAKAKGWKAASLLYALSGLKMKRFAQENIPTPTPDAVLEQYGFKTPSKTVSARDKDGKALLEILVGKKDGEDSFVMVKGGGVVGVAEAARIQDFPSSLKDFIEDPADSKGAAAEDDDG